jgi:hypothetical protein
MAQHMIGALEADSVVAKNRAVAGSVATSGNVYANHTHYTSLTSLDARLTAINATIYTTEVLNKMTANDKVFAVRMNDDLNTI